MLDKIFGLILLLITFISLIAFMGSVLGIVVSILREFRVYSHNLRNAFISGVIFGCGFYIADYSDFIVDRESYLNQQSEQQ